MATRRIEHVFDCDVETFWNQIFLDNEFNRRLFVERLRFARWEVVRNEATADGLRRTVEAVPSTDDLPAPLRRALQNGLGYREEGEWFKSESCYRLRVIPASLSDQLTISGEMRVLPEGTGCRRIYVAEAEARVFMVGGLLESRILSDIVKSYDEAAAFSRQWLAERR